MAKMPGVLRPRWKIDDVELELERSRTAARLADIFGSGAAASSTDLSPTDTPAEVVEADQPREAEQPPDTDAAVGAQRRSGSRPAIVIKLPADLVGVMAKPDEPGLDDQPESDRADRIGAGDQWRSGVDAHNLAVASGNATVGVSNRATDAPVRGESGAIDMTQLTLDADPVGRDREGQLRGTPPRRMSARRAAPVKAAPAPSAVAASCPYCALLIQPPPVSSRSCPRCRHRIIVKRVDGRAVYLTEAAIPVFDAERRRMASFGRWTRERQRWLKLAAAVGSPAERAARLEAAQLSADIVEAARMLYMTTVERSFRSAKHERRWEDASRIRREQAMALFRLAGSPLPPPEAIIKLHQDGLAAELRGIAEIARDAEVVSTGCCDVCQAEDGRIYRISQELRVARLPHQGCPKGLCGCRWDLAVRDQTTVRRHLRRRARTNKHTRPTESASKV